MTKCDCCKVELQESDVYRVANGWERYCKNCADQKIKEIERIRKGDDTRMDVAAKEKISGGTSKPLVDSEPLRLVDLVKGTISLIKIPPLTFSFTRFMKNYWSAFWHGHTLPFKFRINNEVQKEVFAARLVFAATFVLIDSVVLMFRFGSKNRIPWEVLFMIGVIVALNWSEIQGVNLWWLLAVPPVGMIVAVPFSILRFRKWNGFRPILKEKVKPIVEGEEV